MSMSLLTLGIKAAGGASALTSERLAPTAILSSSNLSGSVGDIQDDPDSSDGNWLQAVDDTMDTDLRVSMANPSGTLSGTQEFRILVRSSDVTTPTVDIELWESGSFVSTLRSGYSITSAEVLSDTWSPASISGDGSDVEIRVYGNFTTGGPTNPASTVEVGAIEWNAAY